MSVDLKAIVNRLAKKHNIPTMRAENAARMQFSFIRDMISKGEFKSVIILKLGKFIVKPKRKEILIKYSELKKRQIEAGENPTGLGEFTMAYRGYKRPGTQTSDSVQQLPKEQA